MLPYATLRRPSCSGTVWRYRYDKFGWTTRSSQLYESNVLRWGSPMFHIGILFVLLGHIGGLLIPKSWTEAVGVTEHTYHLTAVFLGTVAGMFTLVGLAILILRRRLVGPVFTATTRNDKAMYVVLAGTIAAGAAGHRAGQRDRRRLRLPRDRLALVPVACSTCSPRPS